MDFPDFSAVLVQRKPFITLCTGDFVSLDEKGIQRIGWNFPPRAVHGVDVHRVGDDRMVDARVPRDAFHHIEFSGIFEHLNFDLGGGHRVPLIC